MLASANRLTMQGDFKQLAGKGKPFYSALITIKVLKNNRPQSRFGIIVSTKVSKKAVVRNRLKRRLSEVIRLNLSEIKSGFDVIIMVKQALAEKKYQEIESELLQLFKKASLLWLKP